MDENEMVAVIEELLYVMSSRSMAEDAGVECRPCTIQTFDEAGVLTADKGLIVKFAMSDQGFTLTVRKS